MEPKDKRDNDELFMSSHLMMILTYTIFSVILIGEIFVMSWEKWAIVLIVAGVLTAWYIHFSQIGNGRLRLWICSILMMATFFFYGIHDTSTYDLAVVMVVVMLLYTMTGISSLITLCQITYYITMIFELYNLAQGGTKFDPLLISRTILHFAVLTMTGWISRTIIQRWNDVLNRSRGEVDQLTETTRRLNDFMANVSHEIRTPINAILGLCRMSIDDEENEEKKEKLESIEVAGKRIGEQISDILDYSEVDRGEVANNYEDYMLSSVLNDLVNELKPYINEEIELIIDVDAAVPMVLNTDVSKLKKILWHLTMNGIKYTKEGGVYVHVFRIPHDYGINLCIEVKDTGIGMDESQLEKIRAGAFKADSGRARATGGLGLGLQIVQGFVRALGGFMTITSTLGSGTCVKVSIPNKVIDPSECMSFNDRDKVSLGAYLHFEKFPNPDVREFYDSMVRNIVTGLKVTMHRVDNTNSLRALTDSKRLTHLFAGPEEYNDAVDFMEDLARKIIVTVVANPGELNTPPNSRIRIMPKPFYCFPVIGVLNTKPGEDTLDEGVLTFPGARVLVVDDEPMNLIVSSGLFKRYGMAVTTCESGQKAIELCRDNEYDVIFMDHMMPGMDGVEAMKRIRSDQARGNKMTPFVAFTANAVSSAKEMFRREGFDGFVGKPVDRIELERVLRRVLPASLVVIEESVGSATPAKAAEKNTEKTVEKTEAQADSLVSKLKSMGVDVEQGLYYSQNDQEFYETLLRQFAVESDDKKKRMAAALESNNLKDYATQAHSIKSTSKMLGDAALSEKAKLLEEAAKKEDRSYVDLSHTDMITAYERLIAVIRGTFEGEDETGSSDTSDEILEFAPVEDAEGGN